MLVGVQLPPLAPDQEAPKPLEYQGFGASLQCNDPVKYDEEYDNFQ